MRRIFNLSAAGHGVKAIAKLLNADGALSPRAQRGRSQSWAPTSVRAILKRTLYRGEIVWAQTAKRDKWGRKHQRRRPESDWIRRPATALQIVSDQEWAAAHARIDAARALYLRGTHGRAFGRPADGTPAKYLLTGLSQCGECGNGLIVKSRSHGQRRAYFYGCGGYHNREQAICSNSTEIPMADGNDIVLEALLDEVLDKTMLTEAIDEAVTILRGTDRADRVTAIETELAKVNEERARLAGAIAAGGQLDGLLSALQARETRRATLEAQREQLRAERRVHASEAARVRDELFELAQSWRRVLADDPTPARPICVITAQGPRDVHSDCKSRLVGGTRTCFT